MARITLLDCIRKVGSADMNEEVIFIFTQLLNRSIDTLVARNQGKVFLNFGEVPGKKLSTASAPTHRTHHLSDGSGVQRVKWWKRRRSPVSGIEQ